MLLFSDDARASPARPDTCQVVLWNLRHGGGNTRTPEQALVLLGHQPDLIVLTEVRASRGSQLLAALAAHDLSHALLGPAADDATNRVAIISREPIAALQADAARLMVARTQDLIVIGAHVPDESAPRARADIWQSLVEAARTHRDQPTVIAADFNTSRRGLDAPRRGQTCERHMGTLASLGFRDAWKPDAAGAHAAWSWAGPRGERHRLDAAMLSERLQKHAENAVYDTTCAQAGVSDHALVHVRLRGRGMWKSEQTSGEAAENSK